ncbi:DUF2232 domain-containing protein [Peribacillus sp. SCS-155]|uniref:DUF2232 domain-containing protein n=1 Tax=Peribacillus sedimenti TaxID=3115297 RepID=UPI003905D710
MVKSKTVQYWRRPFLGIPHALIELSSTTKLILTAALSACAAMSQSAGGYVPGIGFFVSAMTTLPIFLATVVSVRHGFLSYFVTFLLLLFIQPSELIIFAFTTGILGLVLGGSFCKRKTRFWVVILAGAALFIGIMALLFIFRFPVLGPEVDTAFHFGPLLLVGIGSILYAWMAAESCWFALKRLGRALPDKAIKAVSEKLDTNE